ncbi:hypothetical protein H105_00572 [Trichophyton soudanense CBS 452.61]|uniref:Uncharacterized protein n=1 Tax=Trichophyton soudanense CBS 452.61 TaxID=1215331 RepID=A0A022Y670_TRISD|nr:hypothetical protein H105_00572 [Trichophyton soudanense CBS 452.61]EZG10901.1 hypothetical protein H106_00467 [Trichophyton rubrum CBS 735.88]
MVCLFGNPHPFARIPPASAVPFQDFWTYAYASARARGPKKNPYGDYYAAHHSGPNWVNPPQGRGKRGGQRRRWAGLRGSSRSGGGSGGDGGCHCAAHAAGDAAGDAGVVAAAGAVAGDAGVAVHVAVFVAVAVTVAVAVAVAAGTAVCCSVAGEEEEEVQRRVSDALRGQTRSTVTGFCVAPSILPLLTTFVPSGTGGNTPPLDP